MAWVCGAQSYSHLSSGSVAALPVALFSEPWIGQGNWVSGQGFAGLGSGPQKSIMASV